MFHSIKNIFIVIYLHIYQSLHGITSNRFEAVSNRIETVPPWLHETYSWGCSVRCGWLPLIRSVATLRFPLHSSLWPSTHAFSFSNSRNSDWVLTSRSNPGFSNDFQKTSSKGSPKQRARGVSMGYSPGFSTSSALRAAEKRTRLAFAQGWERYFEEDNKGKSASSLKLNNLMPQYNNVGFLHDSP